MDSQQLQFPKDFFKLFKNKEEFQSFFNGLFKQSVEEMLKAELDKHLGYEKKSGKAITPAIAVMVPTREGQDRIARRYST